MNPLKYAQMIKYLTRAKKQKPDLPDVFPASKAPIPAKKQNVEEIEAINEFMKRNPRAEGGRIGFADGPPRKIYKVIREVEPRDYKKNPEIPKNAKFKSQVPTGNTSGPTTKMVYGSTKKIVQDKIVKAEKIAEYNKTKIKGPRPLQRAGARVTERGIKVPTAYEGIDQLFNPKTKTSKFIYTTTKKGAGRGTSKTRRITANSLEDALRKKYEIEGNIPFTKSGPGQEFKIIEKGTVPNQSNIKYRKLQNAITGEVKTVYDVQFMKVPPKGTPKGQGKYSFLLNERDIQSLDEAIKIRDDFRIKNPIVQAGVKDLNKKLKDLFDDPRIKKILKTGRPSAKDIEIVKDIIGGTDRQAQGKLAQLADAVDPKGQRTIDGISKIDGKKAKNIFNFHKTKDIAKELEDIAIGKSVGERPLDSFRRDIQSEIPMKGGLQGYSVDEAKARASSVRLNSKPYSIFGQVIAGDINQGPKQTFDANLSVFEEQVKNAIKNNQDPTEFIKKYNKRATEAEAEANLYKSRNTKKVYFPRITTDSPDKAIKNKSAYTKYKNFFDKNYAQQKYSFVIPKDLQPLPSLAEDLKNKNSSTYKDMIKQIKDVGRKFIKNIDQFDEKELFQKLRNNPNFNTIRRLMPRLASLEDDFTGPGGFPLTAGLDSSIGVQPDPVEEDTFARRNPITTGTGLTTAGTAAVLKATGTPIKTALGKAFRGAGTPIAGPIFAGLNIADRMKSGSSVADAVIDPLTGLELSFPGLFKENLKKITTNPTAQKILSLGRFGRALTPIGGVITAAGLAKDYGEFVQRELKRKAADPEAYRAEQQEQMGMSAAGGGIAKLAGVSSGPPPESGPNSQGLQGLMKRVRNL